MTRHETSVRYSGAPPSPDVDPIASSPSISGVVRVPARFSVLRRLAIGGTSEVVEALDTSTERVVALKLVSGEEARREPASREAELLARLRHPNIVQFEAEGFEAGVRWIAMEHLEGVGLERVMHDHGPLPWVWVQPALVQVLDALEHAHRAGVVHGDIKPANCFCCGFVDLRTAPRLKLLDFGLAERTAAATDAAPDRGAGSVAYMAPELAAGGQATPATDLYAVAVMAHELLLGRVPFGAGGSDSVRWQHRHGSIPPLSGHPELVGLPPAALRAIDQTLNKRPEARPASAQALRRALAPVPTKPRTSGIGRWLKRSRSEPLGEELARLAEHVRRIWIDDYLQETRMGFIDVRQVHRMTGPSGDAMTAPALLPLFERAGRSLLVLGEPGFGKTVAALKLCRALLDLRQRSQVPEAVPVVIPLSAWRGTASEVFGWLSGELHHRYSLPQRRCRQVLRGRQLVLLLDGLDEVPPGLRQGCVGAVNALVESGEFAGVMVTCRTAEYDELGAPLAVAGCVELQRLDLSDVRTRVERQGLTALANALETNSRLAELATIPLMLRLLQGVSREDFFPAWLEGPISAEGLLDRFLERRLSTIEQAERASSLVSVARLAVAEGQGVVRCEALQPRMLKASWARVSYAALGRLGIAAVACFGPVLAVGYSPLPNGDLVVTPAFALELSTKSTLVAGVLFALAALGVGWRQAARGSHQWINVFAAVLTFALTAAWVGFDRPPAAAVMGLEAALLAIVALWAVRPRAGIGRDDVTLDRDLRFRVPSSMGVLLSGVLGLLWAALALASTGTLTAAAYLGTSFGAAGLVLAALKTRRDTIAASWNAAFWKALRSACVAAALTVAVVTLGFGRSFGFAYGLCVALTFGATVFLWLGGTDAILYVVMRLHLAAEGTLPLRSSDLMQRAVAAKIMKPVGPGYAFLHWELAARLLRARSSPPSDQ